MLCKLAGRCAARLLPEGHLADAGRVGGHGRGGRRAALQARHHAALLLLQVHARVLIRQPPLSATCQHVLASHIQSSSLDAAGTSSAHGGWLSTERGMHAKQPHSHEAHIQHVGDVLILLLLHTLCRRRRLLRCATWHRRRNGPSRPLGGARLRGCMRLLRGGSRLLAQPRLVLLLLLLLQQQLRAGRRCARCARQAAQLPEGRPCRTARIAPCHDCMVVMPTSHLSMEWHPSRACRAIV